MVVVDGGCEVCCGKAYAVLGSCDNIWLEVVVTVDVTEFIFFIFKYWLVICINNENTSKRFKKQ